MEGLLLPLLGLAVSAIGVLVYLYFSLKSRLPREVEKAHAIWRAEELNVMRKEQLELAQKDALIQLQQWRKQELDLVGRQQTEFNAIHKAQLESAQKDAFLQLQQWRAQELDLARKQQLEIARSEATVNLEQWKVAHSQGIRQDAIQKSQAVTLGKVTEHFIPYLPDFTFNPKDARFLGSPVDFVVFDGLSDGEVKSVVFIEVKTGKSALSARERKIRNAIQAGRVQWLELRPQWDLIQPAVAGLAPAEADPVEEQAEFDVVLTDSGAKKIEVFKIVRQLAPNLNPKEAADLIDHTPQTVLSAIRQEAAADALAKLEASGASVEVKPHSPTA